MDPFEARLHFIQMLETLTPSQQTVTKGVQFCLKNEELHEDFHSCILEVLDRLDLNSRMNVLYFIESLLHSVLDGTSADHLEGKPYVKNLQRDFKVLLEKVIPNENFLNLSNCVDILINVEQMYGVRNEELIEKYYTLELGESNGNGEDEGSQSSDSKNFSEPNGEEKPDVFAESWEFLISCKQKSLSNRDLQILYKSEYKDNDIVLTRDQITARMETDRERHKRFKETSWMVQRAALGPNNSLNVSKSGIDLLEFDKIWNEFDSINKDDLRELAELHEIAKESYMI